MLGLVWPGPVSASKYIGCMCAIFQNFFPLSSKSIDLGFFVSICIYMCELVKFFFVSAPAFKNPFISVICAQSIPRFICQIPAITFTQPSISHCDFILASLPCVCQFVCCYTSSFFCGLCFSHRLSISFNFFRSHSHSPSHACIYIVQTLLVMFYV